MMNCRIERNLSAAVALLLALMSLAIAQPLRLDFSPSKLSRTERPPAGTRKLECPRCAEPPTIDGEFDDAAWGDAGEIGALSRAKPITRVRVCFDDAGLYLAVTCEELPGRTSTGKAHERDKGAWKDDCIEVWVDPSGKGETSYQFIVSVAGSIYDGKNKGAGGNAKYDPEWQRAVKREEKAWGVEIAIPMAALEVDRWHRTVGFNVGRNGPGLGPRSWNPSYGDTSSSSLILKGEREKVDAVGELEGTVRRGRHQSTVGDALRMTLERSYARPGERWIEARLHIRPNGVALEQTRLKVALFEIAETQPVAEISETPERGQGNLLVDLRSRGLREARLSVELFHETERLSATEAFVSAQDCEHPFQSGQKITVKLDAPEGNEGLKAWPVTFGVPFPAGAIWDAKKLRLVDRSGKEIPHQKEVTGLWAPEGAIKWVRFDALVSPADGCFAEAAAPGPGAQPARPVLVKEKQAKVILETGAARYVLGKGSSPVEEVWLGGKRVAVSEGTRGLYVVDQSGRLASAYADGEEMKIEARGPVAVCVRFEGFYRTPKGDALARHITRIEAFAGQPFAKVTHTLVLTNDTNKVWFTDIGWEFAVTPGVEPKAIFNVSRVASQKSHALPLDAKAPAAFMLQDSHYRFGHGINHFLVAKIGADDGATTVAEGTECGDWGALAGKDAGFGLGCKEAARQHPKEFEVHRDRIILHLFSSRSGEELDFRAPALVKRWNLVNWYARMLPERFKPDGPKLAEKVSNFTSNAVGWAKTHELLLAPVPGRDSASTIAKLSHRQSRPVFAVAEPGWICESKALGPIHAKDIKRFALAEKLIEGTFDVWERRIDEWGEHGFVDYFAGPHLQYSGKFAKPYRYSAYTYTLRGDLWLIYARSGDRRIREFAESTNRAYMDNIFAHWNGNGKVRGLYVVSSDTDRQTGDGKGCLPFYWEGNPVMEISSSSNLDNFILLYYLTGYRRGKDHVLQYAEGVKRFWTKAKAKRSWRGLMLMRLLTQAYSFTWDPELRALAEATTDTFVDSEGEVGLTKERPYRSSTYKTQVDIAALLDARNVYGSDRYSDLSTKIAGFWWHNLLGKWPIFYTNPQGRIGHFLYRRAGDPSYAQGLLVQMRQAATAYYPDTGKVTGSASGNIGAEDSTFVFQGIPYTQDVVVKTGADKTPASSWACYEDFGYPSSIVLHKGDDGSLEIDVKTETEGKGAAGGVRLRAIEPATTSGMNLCRVSSTSSGAVTVRVPKDAPEGDYEIVPSTPGSHFALAHARVPLVVHAPDYFRPMPPQAPPVRWYFQVPENSRNGRILLESAASLFSPDGRPWADGKPVSGWIDLPSDKPGLWSFEATGYRLVAVRNLPPFFAAEDPKSYFIPKIPWQRTAAAELSTGKAPTDVRYVPGAVNVDGDQALSMTGRRRFSLNAGPDHPSGDGGQFVPFQQGTIEFFFRPNWSVFDLPEKHTKWLVRIQSTGNTWTLSYMKDLKARQWLLSHVLYGWFYSDGPMRRVTMRANRRTVIERGRWSHIAWVWGRQEQASFTGTSRSKVLTARLFVNGRAGMQYSYRWEGQLPADRPKQFSLSGKIDAAYDELRLSDVQRYTADFIPPSRDGELRLDEHTRALFHFNGDTKGESHGHAGPMPVSLSP